MTALTLSQRAGRLPVPVADAVLAISLALVMVAYHAAMGFPTLADSGGDNDSLMRLVRVRDLLAGQGWFDPMQYRMGLEGGLAMHWSRLVDLPIAVLVALFGETVALVAWPALLYAAAMFFLLRAARNVGEEFVALPAVVIGGLALYYLNIFPPGALDHHNVQLVLALAMLVMLLRHEAPLACGAAAGAIAALMLAVGMEAAPLVAVACLSMAAGLLFGPRTGVRRARGFGAGFGGMALACFVLSVPPGEWFAAQCDAFSIAQASLAALGGFGLAAIASIPALRDHGLARAVALGGLGALAGGTLIVIFPQCLADPYAGLDPRLTRFWLSAVSEAQSVSSVLRADPSMFAAYYITPAIALAVMPLVWRRGESREMAVMTALLAAAFLLSLWQVRGSIFSLPFATIPLAAWVAQARERAAARPSATTQLAMLCAWVVSFNIVWQTAAHVILAPSRATYVDDVASRAANCTAAADYVELASLPAGTVLAVSNLGAPILAHTSHRVLSGPYHRNGAGNLAALDLFMGAPSVAKDKAAELGIDYVLMCPGNSETKALRDWAPDGLLDTLAGGNAPSWLTPVGDSHSMSIYRMAATQN